MKREKMNNRLNFDKNKGVNIWKTDGSDESQSPETKALIDLVSIIVANTVKHCETKEISLTVLPSVYINCFTTVYPLIKDSIYKDDPNNCKNFKEMHKAMLNKAIEILDENG